MNTKIDWDKIYKKGSPFFRPKKSPLKGPSKSAKEFIKYLKEGDKILDVGCGIGRDSIFFAKKGYEVWGIDTSKEAIKMAKKFQSKNLRFLVADATKLPFEDGFFDAVYSRYVLQFVPLKKAASEIFRVLKENGIAFLTFLLNWKILATGRSRKFHDKESIITTYKEHFKILKQIEYKIKDLDVEEPHIHDALIIVIQKQI